MKKSKDPLEQVFGQGKRLPVFTVITYAAIDAQKKQVKPKKQGKAKKIHNFNKQLSETIATSAHYLDNLLLPAITISSKKSKKKFVLSEEK